MMVSNLILNYDCSVNDKLFYVFNLFSQIYLFIIIFKLHKII